MIAAVIARPFTSVPSTAYWAAFSPAGPPPTTTTSYSLVWSMTRPYG